MDCIWRHGAADIQVTYPISNREQAQEVGMIEGQWRFQTTLWKGKAPSGSVAGGGGGGGVEVYCTTTPPMDLCGRNMSEINSWAEIHEEKWQRVSTKQE